MMEVLRPLLVTDIINGGTYTREGDAIVTEWVAADVPSEITFTPSQEGAVLTDDWQDWAWTRVEETATSCE